MDKQFQMNMLVDYAITNNVSSQQIDLAMKILRLLKDADFPDTDDTVRALELASVALEIMK